MKKTTSKELSKKITRYGALSAAIAGVSNINGQIVYSGIVDVTDYNNTYNLDLDGDTNTDFVFSHAYVSEFYYNFLTFNVNFANNPQNAVIGSWDTYIYPFALNQNDVISNGNSNWINDPNIGFLNRYTSCYNSKSEWCSSISKSTPKYLGLRFEISGDIYFGWARLEIGTDPADWLLKDYAYNATDTDMDGIGDPIMAGQQTLGVKDNALDKVKIVALNKSIALYNLTEKLNYRVFDMSGKEALKGKIDDHTYLIEANTLSSGIYIIELQDKQTQAVIRKKIVL